MRTVLAFFITLIITVWPVSAHVTLPAEFREVVSDASLIVRGRVTDVRSVMSPESRIESVATVAVESVLKGHADAFVYVRVPGGEIGRSRVVMVGAPMFKTGQRAVLFLRPSATDSSYRPIGLTMGVYRVQAEPGTGRAVVEPPLIAGVTASATGPAVRGDTRRSLMAVQDFEALVRQVIATPPGRAIPRGGGR